MLRICPRCGTVMLPAELLDSVFRCNGCDMYFTEEECGGQADRR